MKTNYDNLAKNIFCYKLTKLGESSYYAEYKPTQTRQAKKDFALLQSLGFVCYNFMQHRPFGLLQKTAFSVVWGVL